MSQINSSFAEKMMRKQITKRMVAYPMISSNVVDKPPLEEGMVNVRPLQGALL
jgi:hypothetical protein